MRLELLERRSEGTGPLHRLDPRLKLLTTAFFVCGAVATPMGAWRYLAAEGLVLAFAVGLAGVPPRDLLRQWLGFFVLVIVLAFMVATSHPERRTLGTWTVLLTIIAKNSLAFLAMVTLASVTPFHKLLQALRLLRVPLVLVTTLQFMYRYLHVLTDELDRMVKARRARTFRRSVGVDWGLFTGLIGILFLRAFERGERVHAAMVARGWDGMIRTLDDPEPSATPVHP